MSGGESSDAVLVGARVDVWNRFVGAYTGPYEVVEVAADGARLRRVGDRDPLPVRFAPGDLVVSEPPGGP